MPIHACSLIQGAVLVAITGPTKLNALLCSQTLITFLCVLCVHNVRALQFCMLTMWEFSYSSYFEENVYLVIVLFKVVQIGIEALYGEMLRENLMAAPLLVVICE
jgi:hypothetical protein